MRIGIIAALAAILVFSSMLIGQAAPQSPSASTKFDPHDLSGFWNMSSRVQTYANVNPGRGARGNGPAPNYVEAPFTPEGKAKFDSHKPGYGPRAIPPALGNDPIGMCDPLGIPRNIVQGWAPLHDWLDIVQTPTRTIFFIEWHHDWRVVFTDGRQLPKVDEELEPKWNGYSVGKWDGDTFVVDSVGFDERAWVDKFGYPHSDQMRLQERWRRVNATTLELRMTITDPVFYTKPFEAETRTFTLHPEKAKEWDDQLYCAPSEEFKFNGGVRNGAGGVTIK